MPAPTIVKGPIMQGFANRPALSGYPNISAAYSLRKLVPNYSGPAIRVRRSSDNAELDIPFCYDPVSREYVLCTRTLQSFVGNQNLFKYSEEFDQTPTWLKQGVGLTIDADAGISPVGSITADRFNFPAAGSQVFQQLSDIGSGTFTMRVMAKHEGTPATFTLARYNATDGLTNSPTFTTTDTWVQYSHTFTTSIDSSSFYIRAAGAGSSLFWGAQINNGSAYIEYTKSGVGAAGNGFVTMWYDQGGAGNSAVQATANLQPRIVNAGTLYTINGRPSLNWFDAASTTDMALETATNTILGHVVSVFQHADGIDSAGGANQRLFSTVGGADRYGIRVNAEDGTWLGLGYDTATKNGSAPYSLAGTAALPLPLSVYTFSTSTRNDIFKIGNIYESTRNWNGGISEFIGCRSTLSTTDRQKLERNQGKFFGITFQ